jgi:hypothetical protein
MKARSSPECVAERQLADAKFGLGAFSAHDATNSEAM